MNRSPSGNRTGYLNGFVRFVLFLLYTEFMVCKFVPFTSLSAYAVAGLIFWLLSCAAYGVLMHYSGQGGLRYYLSSQAVFYGFVLLDFLNRITVKISLLPAQEGNAGDGLMLLFCLGGYWALSEIAQLLIGLMLTLRKKLNKK